MEGGRCKVPGLGCLGDTRGDATHDPLEANHVPSVELPRSWKQFQLLELLTQRGWPARYDSPPTVSSSRLGSSLSSASVSAQ